MNDTNKDSEALPIIEVQPDGFPFRVGHIHMDDFKRYAENALCFVGDDNVLVICDADDSKQTICSVNAYEWMKAQGFFDCEKESN